MDMLRIPKENLSKYYDGDSELAEYRTSFMRDRDRVMYCTAFRRLAGKTQIYTIGSDDHKKNRLTHSLEVAQIARTIAYALGFDCDLAEAIALGHDLGHTPFGHAGEQILNEIMTPNSPWVKNSPFYSKGYDELKNVLEREKSGNSKLDTIDSWFGFKHNIQSVRVAAVLEDNYRGAGDENIGLNLNNYTLWGLMHHSGLEYKNDNRIINYQNAYNKMVSIRNSSNEAWSFEAYIVKIADDIAQWHHDLEDAIRGQALPISTICDTIQNALGEDLSDSDIVSLRNNKEMEQVTKKSLAELSHIVVNTLINDVYTHSKQNLENLVDKLRTCFPNSTEEKVAQALFADYSSVGLSIAREDVIGFSEKIKDECFKEVIKNSVHHSRDVSRMNEKGKYIIRKIFEAYYSHPQQLPDGPILHFMVEIGRYKSIEDARNRGIGSVRTLFDKEMNNPKLSYKSLLMRRICDHIASMTDRYAIDEYNSLYG